MKPLSCTVTLWFFNTQSPAQVKQFRSRKKAKRFLRAVLAEAIYSVDLCCRYEPID